ncbi:MAG TPA: sigma-70 family RNA polymerase sigma factor [Minicystis sp.]|nr:sigma-70 family RNA polymerase sigma factor [Minicystis sp.]
MLPSRARLGRLALTNGVVPELELDRAMARLARGDRSAFDLLFRALHPRAVRLARARLAADLADDAAQTALVAVFARASDFDAGRPVLPWFYAIVSNEIRAAARRRARVASDGDAPLDAFAAPGDPERDYVEQELRRALASAVAELDAQAAESIAALLGDAPRPAIRDVAFRKRVSRAYAALRVLLGGFHGD